MQKRGMAITVHSLRNHVAENKFKITFVIMAGRNVVSDMQGQVCLYYTGTHDPSAPNANGRPGTGNRKEGDSIIWNEEIKVLKDLSELEYEIQNGHPIYVSFNMLEKKDENM